jgi:hypothetical protein
LEGYVSKRAPDNADTKRGIVAYLLAGEPALEAWLMELGLIASHEETIWMLAASGKTALAGRHPGRDRHASTTVLH